MVLNDMHHLRDLEINATIGADPTSDTWSVDHARQFGRRSTMGRPACLVDKEAARAEA